MKRYSTLNQRIKEIKQEIRELEVLELSPQQRELNKSEIEFLKQELIEFQSMRDNLMNVEE